MFGYSNPTQFVKLPSHLHSLCTPPYATSLQGYLYYKSLQSASFGRCIACSKVAEQAADKDARNFLESLFWGQGVRGAAVASGMGRVRIGGHLSGFCLVPSEKLVLPAIKVLTTRADERGLCVFSSFALCYRRSDHASAGEGDLSCAGTPLSGGVGQHFLEREPGVNVRSGICSAATGTIGKGPIHRPARNRDPLAPTRVPILLAVEEPCSLAGATENTTRG